MQLLIAKAPPPVTNNLIIKYYTRIVLIKNIS
jgi:hypothetical protein